MRRDAAFISALERANIHPLWDRYQRITPMAPKAKDAPMHWRWRDLEPFTERAAREVAIEDVERRALILAHPAFGGATVTTQNLIGAFTVLEPGDKAVPHRHTAAAIRFATRAEGAVTIVNGRRCEMHEADLVLTPPMCWHGHINQGKRRTVWFDAANMPAICALDASFFEPGKRQDERFWEVSDAGSQEYRFPGDETRRQVDAMPPAADGAQDAALHPERRLGDADTGSVLQADRERRRGRIAPPTTRSASWCRARVARRSASRPSSGRSTMFSPCRTGPGRAMRRAALAPSSSSSPTARSTSASTCCAKN